MEVLYDAHHILGQLPELYEDDFIDRKAANGSADSNIMWLRFALWSDKHEYLICCDRSSAAFGKIFDAYDVRPWMDDINFIRDSFKSNTFIEFLENW